MNTLRGIFPDPLLYDNVAAQAPKRNFIQENKVQVKRMQGYVDETRNDPRKRPNVINSRTMKLIRNTRKQLEGLSRLSASEKKGSDKNMKNKLGSANITSNNVELSPYYKTAIETYGSSNKGKFKDIGVQTEQFSKREKGTIKYASVPKPSHNSIKSPDTGRRCADNKSAKTHKGDGDNQSRRSVERSSPTYDNRNYSADNNKQPHLIRENMQSLRNSAQKNNVSNDPTMAPPTYQKGVVPKYLRDRKEMNNKQSKSEESTKCPEGHVVLPDNERKETLRMLRQSYAELVTELNQLPVRSDTLKIRNRKIEIENQLKKLDEGIKVFTRPKVYVKMGM